MEQSDLNATIYEAEVTHRLEHVEAYLRDFHRGGNPSSIVPLGSLRALQEESRQAGHDDISELCGWMEQGVILLETLRNGAGRPALASNKNPEILATQIARAGDYIKQHAHGLAYGTSIAADRFTPMLPTLCLPGETATNLSRSLPEFSLGTEVKSECEAALKVTRPQQHTGDNEPEEIDMSEGPRVDDFGRRLLDHVEMLYRIALGLTRDPRGAKYITRSALSLAWRRREEFDNSPQLKGELLRLLRSTFLEHYEIAGVNDLADASAPCMQEPAYQDDFDFLHPDHHPAAATCLSGVS